MSGVTYAEVKNRDEIQARMEQKRAYFLQLQVGDRVEFDIGVGRWGNKKIVKQGEILSIAPRHITVKWLDHRGNSRKETIGLAGFLTGENMLRKIAESPVETKGGDDLVRRIIEPPAEELLEKYEELKSIQRLGDNYGVHTNTAQKWLKSARRKMERKKTVEPPKEEIKAEEAPVEDLTLKDLLRFECEAKEIEREPIIEEINWYAVRRPKPKISPDPTIRICANKIYISKVAAEMVGIKAGDHVSVGTTSRAIYIRKDDKGALKVGADHAKVMFSSKGVSRQMEDWEMPCVLLAEEKDGMLVAWRPEVKERVS
jgi:hypothetical protein